MEIITSITPFFSRTSSILRFHCNALRSFVVLSERCIDLPSCRYVTYQVPSLDFLCMLAIPRSFHLYRPATGYKCTEQKICITLHFLLRPAHLDTKKPVVCKCKSLTCKVLNGAPSRTRTCGLLLRRFSRTNAAYCQDSPITAKSMICASIKLS